MDVQKISNQHQLTAVSSAEDKASDLTEETSPSVTGRPDSVKSRAKFYDRRYYRSYSCGVVAHFLQRPVIPCADDWYPDQRLPLCHVTLAEFWHIFEDGDHLDGELPRPRYRMELRDGVLVSKKKCALVCMMTCSIQCVFDKAFGSIGRVHEYGFGDFYIFPSMKTDLENAYTDGKKLGKGTVKTFDIGMSPRFRVFRGRKEDGPAFLTTFAVDLTCDQGQHGLTYRMDQALAPDSPVMMFLGIDLPYKAEGEIDDCTEELTGTQVTLLYAERGGRKLVRSFDYTNLEEFKVKRQDDSEADFPDWPCITLPRELLLDDVPVTDHGQLASQAIPMLNFFDVAKIVARDLLIDLCVRFYGNGTIFATVLLTLFLAKKFSSLFCGRKNGCDLLIRSTENSGNDFIT